MTDIHIAVVALEAGSRRVGGVLACKLVPGQAKRSKLQAERAYLYGIYVWFLSKFYFHKNCFPRINSMQY